MKVDVLFQDINVSLHNPTKKAWRKSLRHAPIKESLIVKIEISDSSTYSGTNLFNRTGRKDSRHDEEGRLRHL